MDISTNSQYHHSVVQNRVFQGVSLRTLGRVVTTRHPIAKATSGSNKPFHPSRKPDSKTRNPNLEIQKMSHQIIPFQATQSLTRLPVYYSTINCSLVACDKRAVQAQQGLSVTNFQLRASTSSSAPAPIKKQHPLNHSPVSGNTIKQGSKKPVPNFELSHPSLTTSICSPIACDRGAVRAQQGLRGQ